jgi:hypothetical protein
MKIPTDEQATKIREIAASDVSHDEAVAKVVEITGWPGADAAEWIKVARTGELDLDLSGL